MNIETRNIKLAKQIIVISVISSGVLFMELMGVIGMHHYGWSAADIAIRAIVGLPFFVGFAFMLLSAVRFATKTLVMAYNGLRFMISACRMS